MRRRSSGAPTVASRRGRAPAASSPRRATTADSRRLDALQVDGPGAGLLADRAYRYDEADRITSVIDGVGSRQHGRRLRPARSTGSQHPLSKRACGDVRTNEYDAIGNLLCRDATGPNCAGGTRLAYPFAANDPLQRATNHRATEVGGAASVYDASGAVLTLGNRRFYYNAFARLTEVWDGGTLALRASYDGNGRTHRLWSASAGETQYFPTDDFEWGEHIARGARSRDARRCAHRHARDGLRAAGPDTQVRGPGAGSRGRRPSPFDLFGLFAPGLVALLLLGARRGWRGVPEPRRARVLVATATGTAFLLVTLVPVPFARRGDAVAQSVVPSSLYYHGDHLGSVLVVTDANGALVGAPAAFEPWGRTIDGDSLPTAFGFNGKRSCRKSLRLRRAVVRSEHGSLPAARSRDRRSLRPAGSQPLQLRPQRPGRPRRPDRRLEPERKRVRRPGRTASASPASCSAPASSAAATTASPPAR